MGFQRNISACFALKSLIFRFLFFCSFYRTFLCETIYGDMSMNGKLSTQIAFVSVVFGGMVIYNLWDAMLMSFLASRKTYLPFQTIEELLENSHYKLVLSKNAGVYLDRFRHTRDPVRINDKLAKEIIHGNWM